MDWFVGIVLVLIGFTLDARLTRIAEALEAISRRKDR